MNAKFAGSKRKARIAALEERQVKAVKNRLRRIYALSKLIQSPEELDTMLGGIDDEAVREETRKLILTFVNFEPPRIVLADGNTDFDSVKTSHPADLPLIRES